MTVPRLATCWSAGVHSDRVQTPAHSSPVVPGRARIVVVGGSAGALEVLVEVVSRLPGDFPAPIIVAIHFPASSISHLANVLDRAGPLPAASAVDGDALLPGRIYVPPADHHVVVTATTVRLNREARENGHRPAIDPLFRSAAEHHGAGTVALLLSGMLDDGSAGMLAVRLAGGVCIVQDPSTCDFADMPENAIRVAKPVHVVRKSVIPQLLVDLTAPRNPEGASLDDEAMSDSRPVASNDLAGGGIGNDDAVHGFPGDRASSFTCPNCNGPLAESDTGQFQCLVGHRFSAMSLFEQQSDGLEQALWAAVRALQEQSALASRIAERAAEDNNHRAAERFRERADRLRTQAEKVRAVILGEVDEPPT